MPKPKTILIVCTGNSCRSVMAAGLLEKLLAGKGDYQVISAGTGTFPGMRPTQETVQLMREEGIDVSGHRSRSLNDQLIREADLILVMQRIHREIILQRWRRAKNKVHLLTEFARMEEEKKLVVPDIPDPIGKPLEFYRKVYEIIKEGVLRTAKGLE